MKVLYIGQYSTGTTSKMRADTLSEILRPTIFDVIDTNIPFYSTNRVFRSIGFRLKKGPLIQSVNRYILNSHLRSSYDLIWIDKATFIEEKTTIALRDRANILVHFTPDTAFFENQSNLFYKSANYYDYVVTTKSFEIDNYNKLISKSKLIITTQGFDNLIHYPRNSFDQKEPYVLFIGLCEPSRKSIIQSLIKNGIHVKIAGKGWNRFVRSNNNANLEFLGSRILQDDYAKCISKAQFGLGLLSKRFPELHTTRTFEIPASGTALLTERNSETSQFFKDDEVIFYKNGADLVKKIQHYWKHPEMLKTVTEKGYLNVTTSGYDYNSILQSVLAKVLN